MGEVILGLIQKLVAWIAEPDMFGIPMRAGLTLSWALGKQNLGPWVDQDPHPSATTHRERGSEQSCQVSQEKKKHHCL